MVSSVALETRVAELEKENAALRQERRFLRLALNNIPGMVFWKDTESVYLGCNAKVAEVNQLEGPESIVGLTDDDLSWGDQADLYRKYDREVMAAGEPRYHIEETILQADGERRWIDVCKIPLRDDAGHVVGILGTSEDITERKQAEAQLGIFKALADNTTDYVAYLELGDLSETLAYVNPAGLAMIGRAGQDPTTIKIADTHLPEDGQRITEEVIPAVMEHGIWSGETRLLHTDGSLIDVSQVVVRIDDEDGQPRALGTIMRDITAQKRATHQKEQRYGALYSAMTEGIAVNEVIYNDAGEAVDYTILEVNSTYEAITGLAREQAIGMKASDLYDDFEEPPYLDTFVRVAETGEATQFEIYTPSEERHFRILVVAPEKGQFATIFDDITEQKRAETSLRASQQRLASLIAQSPMAVIEWDLDFCVREWNPAAEQIFGYTRAEALGRHAAGLIVPESVKDLVDQVWRDLLAQTGGTRSTNDNFTKDGRMITCEWYNTPLVDTDGHTIGVASLVADITDRKQSEEALRLTNERLNSVLMAGNLAWWDWNYATGRVDFHERKATMLGYDPDALNPDVDTFTAMIHPDDFDQAMGAMRAHLKGAAPIYETEYRIQTKDGAWKWFYDRGAIVDRDDEGQPSRIMGLVLDITQRKEAEAASQQEKLFANMLINNLPGIFYVYDEEGRLQRWNHNLEVVTGYPHEALTARSALDFFPEAEKAMIAEKIQEVFKDKPVATEGHLLTYDGRQIPYHFAAFMMEDGGERYLVGIGTDISALKRAEAEQARLQQEIIDAQREALQELSTPVIPVMDRILVMPLVGNIDTMRARDIMRVLLQGISDHRAQIVILDVTGVPIMDTGIVNHINKTIHAARLKGAHAIVTGISDVVAEAVVDLGIDWSDVQTLRDLQTGLRVALEQLGKN